MSEVINQIDKMLLGIAPIAAIALITLGAIILVGFLVSWFKFHSDKETKKAEL